MHLLINKCFAMEALYVAIGLIVVGSLAISELWKRGKLNVERHLVLFLIRTERGKGLIKRAAQHALWTHVGTLSIAVGLLGMVFGFAVLANHFYSAYVLQKPVPEDAVQLVIPGVTIPFWYGLLGLLTVLVVHEFSHGILIARENVTIKSLGAALVGAIPVGAFVEPDEEELKTKPRISRLRVYAMGSFGNLVLALLAFFALGFISNSALTSSVYIVNVSDSSPASGVLEKEMVIREINGVKIATTEEFRSALKNVKPNEVVTVKTDKGSFSIKTAPRENEPEKGFIGITVAPRAEVKKEVADYLGESLPLILFSSFYWIFLLNLGIGVMNLLPLHLVIAATDGHLMLKDFLGATIREESAEKVSLFVSSIMMLAVLFLVIVKPPNTI